jgi:hypothetical protein
MGNIYFEQGKFDQAIKMYNMALDSTMQQNKEMKMKISKTAQAILDKVRSSGYVTITHGYEDLRMNRTYGFREADAAFKLVELGLLRRESRQNGVQHTVQVFSLTEAGRKHV